MENVPLPEFKYELSQRDGIRKFHYKPPDTVGDLTKAFPFMSAMNNSSPKLSEDIVNEKVSSSSIESDERNGSKVE